MNQTPLVSIVTPCLEPGPALERCVQSVKKQTYAPLEHIIVDGGSTDGTVQLLHSLQGVKWLSEPDSGQAAAINKGFRLGSGEIVSWLNADDELKPVAIEACVSALASQRAGWVYGNIEVKEGNSVRVLRPSPRPLRDLFDLGKGGVIPQPGTLIRREALERVGELDERFQLAMDFDLWLRLINAGVRSAYVNKTLATFHVHPASKSGRLGMDQFFMEEAISLRKNGRPELSELALGRAAARRAFGSKSVSAESLRRSVEEVLEHSRSELDRLSRRRVRAAARTDAALLETQYSPLGLRHVFALDPWLVKQTRARMVAALVKAAKEPFGLTKNWRSSARL